MLIRPENGHAAPCDPVQNRPKSRVLVVRLIAQHKPGSRFQKAQEVVPFCAGTEDDGVMGDALKGGWVFEDFDVEGFEESVIEVVEDWVLGVYGDRIVFVRILVWRGN